MLIILKKILRFILSFFDLELVRKSKYDEFKLKVNHLYSVKKNICRLQDHIWGVFSFDTLLNSKSDLGQDLIAIKLNNYKIEGYFVEIGAFDGIKSSNTFLLEKTYGWKGICVEAAKESFRMLERNRECITENTLIYSLSDLSIEFSETTDGRLSTISSLLQNDFMSSHRKVCDTYILKTLSLNDLLRKYMSPHKIEYISIDTEGSEFEILSSFNFEEYEVNFFSIEHNYGSQKKDISKLLISKGYKPILSDISAYDGWFINIKFAIDNELEYLFD